MRRSVLIAGCGFVGLPLARNLVDAGWETHAITASKQSATLIEPEAFRVYALDISKTDSLRQLGRNQFDVVIHCASSGRGNADDYEAVFYRGSQNLLGNLESGQFLFTSSTSVYPQSDGAVVNEESEANPLRETGRILRKTENLVLAANGIVARLAGLYGPGRCVPLQKLRDGRAIVEADGLRVMNLLHQADAAGALQFLAEKALSGVYNVVDDLPVTQIEWYRYVCASLGKPLPPNGAPDLGRKRGWSSKSVSNRKLRAMGWEPLYPTFREGLQTLLKSEEPERKSASPAPLK